MKYFRLPLGFMQESGSALLRAMQNESMIPLDLLIREAVQNSLDAALGLPGSEVSVDIAIREHTTDMISDLLEGGIDEEVLFRLFPEGGQLLEIRDKQTEGLTGPVGIEDVGRGQPRGNLLKLVYEVGKPRGDGVSGGSWGLGKTCYFRVGVGLVFYYSRILVDNCYEERFVACLVENETDEDRLQRDSATGIAWWGGEKGAPLVDSTRIADLLESIGVQPFTGGDTGTAIIIPFLRKDLIPLPDEVAPEDSDDSTCREPLPWWFENYTSYVRVALQRWFCARIDNLRFRGGPALSVSVNGQRLQRARMQPVYQVLQALYNRLDAGTSLWGDDYLERCGVDVTSILNKSIDLNGVFRAGTSAGRITAVRLTAKQLKMTVPDNAPDPYRSIFSPQEHAQRSRPLVAFMRGPGMVIRWDNSTDPKSWGGGAMVDAGDSFLVGLFVPEKNRELKQTVRDKLRSPEQTLEAYLRSCERADHHQWVDHAGLTIVSRIRGKAGNAIGEFNAPIAARPQGISLRAARNLADRLLPAGFGQDGRLPPAPPDTPESGGQHQRRKVGQYKLPDLEVTEVRYGNSEMRICWQLYWGKGQASRQIVLSVDSESRKISYKKWIEEGLGTFPLRIESATVTGLFSPHITIGLEVDGLLLEMKKGQLDMDGATVHGELTIRMPDSLAGNLRPVLHATVLEAKGGAV